MELDKADRLNCPQHRSKRIGEQKRCSANVRQLFRNHRKLPVTAADR